jgi:hypothetical protein
MKVFKSYYFLDFYCCLVNRHGATFGAISAADQTIVSE